MWRCLSAAPPRRAHFLASAVVQWEKGPMLAGGSRLLMGHSGAHSRRQQHTEAEQPVEVDMKRLEGADNGREESLSK